MVLDSENDAPLGKVVDQKSVLKQFAREMNTITDSQAAKTVLYHLDDISEVYSELRRAGPPTKQIFDKSYERLEKVLSFLPKRQDEVKAKLEEWDGLHARLRKAGLDGILVLSKIAMCLSLHAGQGNEGKGLKERRMVQSTLTTFT